MEYLVIGIAAVVGVVIGLIVGIIIGVDRMRKAIEEQSIGHLRIDRSEPDEPPKPFLEVANGTIETIATKDFVMLKVINESYLSCD